MSDAKATHTPGPWTADETSEDAIDVLDSKGRSICVASYLLCIEHPGESFRFDKITESEFRANGRLIASAPDLLKAARHALAWFNDPDNLEHQDAYDALEQAIIKAEGGEA